MKFQVRIEVYMEIEADNWAAAGIAGNELAEKAAELLGAESAVASVKLPETPCRICRTPTGYSNGYCGPCWNRNYDQLTGHTEIG